MKTEVNRAEFVTIDQFKEQENKLRHRWVFWGVCLIISAFAAGLYTIYSVNDLGTGYVAKNPASVASLIMYGLMGFLIFSGFMVYFSEKKVNKLILEFLEYLEKDKKFDIKEE